MKIAPTFPVIGPLLYRRLSGVIDKVKSGNLEAVRELTALARADSYAYSQEIAFNTLGALSSPDAIDVFCNEVLIHQDPLLEKIATDRGYTPSEPGLRALFLYITGQHEALCRLDPDPYHPFLARGYAAAPDRIKTRALHYSSGTGMGGILACALMGTDPARGARRWSYGEWEAVISGLTEDRAWDVLWQLVVCAPLSLAIAALNSMKIAGWRPGGDEGQVFEELIRELPEAWIPPMSEKPLVSMGNQDSQCLNLAFSRDGTLLAAGYSDGKMEIWQVSSARLITSITTNAGPIGFLAITPDNSYIISGGNDGTLTCYGIPQGNTVWSYADKDHSISCVAMSGNGEEIIAGDSSGKTIRIACRTGKTLLAVQGHPSRVVAISPAHGGKSIACGYADGTIRCQDTVSGVETWTVSGTGDAIRALAYTEQADQLFVVYERFLPVLKDGNSGITVRTFTTFSGHPSCHAISAENRRAAIGSNDHVLRFWNWTEKNPTAELPFYNRLPTCCAFTPDGILAIAGCNEGTIYFFSVPERLRIKEFRGYRQTVTACVISPDGKLLASAGGDGTVTLRSIPSGELLRTLRRPAGAVTAFSLTSGAAGNGIVAGTTDGRVCIFSREDGTLVRSIDVYTPSVRALAVSPDREYFACAGKDRSLRIWDLAKGGLVATCESLTTTARCLAFLPDTETFISCGWDGAVRIRGISGGKPIATLLGHSSNITCCCIDPQGRLFVTGSNDTTLRIWQLNGEKKSIVLRDAKHEVSACAISRDGTFLAAAGADPVIRLYHLPEGTAAGTIPQIPGRPTTLTFTDDGLAIAAGYNHGALAFYALYGHFLIRTIPAHAGAVTGIAAIKSGDCIVTSGIDGMIHVFRVPFMRPLSQTTLADLALAREQEQATGTNATTNQWRFLCNLLSIRFQNEIELCPTYRDAGMYDIQIAG